VVQRKYSEERNYTPETIIARNLFRGFIFLLLNTFNTVSRFFRFVDALDGPHLTLESLGGRRCFQTAPVRSRYRDIWDGLLRPCTDFFSVTRATTEMIVSETVQCRMVGILANEFEGI